jgi:hypothetical protein
MSSQLLTRMFLVSLVAGPAAGGADVLLMRSTGAYFGEDTGGVKTD